VNATSKRLFLLLIASQALHSIEEYYFSLWEVLAPARFLSGLVSANLSVGFAILNVTIVALGLWTYARPVRRNRSYALPLVWFWTILEMANGVGHTIFALASGSYFPGVYTAPLLLVFSGLLAVQLTRRSRAA
jgi:Protein of unknown function with HXXEE motif